MVRLKDQKNLKMLPYMANKTFALIEQAAAKDAIKALKATAQTPIGEFSDL